MNRKLKKFLFVLLGIVLSVGVVAGGYFLFTNLAKVTIYDLKILNDDGDPINDTSVYLTDEEHNKFYIELSIDTSNGAGAGYFVSSNKSVATVKKDGSSYYVEYYKPGQTTITLFSNSTSSVKDSFTLTVYEDFIQKVTFYQVVNGEEKEYSDNIINVYGNGLQNTFGYKSNGMLDGSTGNDALLRVVDNYNKDVIKSVEINQTKNEVYITTNLTKENSVQTINLQTYYADENGQEHIVKNFDYQVAIIGYDIKEIQLIVNSNHDLEESNNIYLDREYYTYSTKVPFKLADDNVIDELCLTQDIDKVFFKIRIVFTDNSYEETLGSDVASRVLDCTYYQIKTDNPDYWLICYDTTGLPAAEIPTASEAKKQFYIGYSCQRTVGNRTISCSKDSFFYITYLKESDTDATYNQFINKSLYIARVDEANNILYYEYTYWDPRFARNDAITNTEKHIIGFSSGFVPNCNTKRVGE